MYIKFKILANLYCKVINTVLWYSFIDSKIGHNCKYCHYLIVSLIIYAMFLITNKSTYDNTNCEINYFVMNIKKS